MKNNKEPEISYSYSLKSCTGETLFCKYWPTLEPPKALVFIAHGFAEHCMRYDDMAKALAIHGVLPFAHDFVGHGRSSGPRALVKNFDDCTEDVFRHVDLMKTKYPNLPLFLIGFSMGGTIAIKAGLKRPNDFKGIVILAGGIWLPPADCKPYKRHLANFFGNMIPSFPAGRIILNKALRTKEAIQKRFADPYIYSGSWLKVGYAKALLNAVKELENQLENTAFPMLIIHGAQDMICDVQGAKKLYESTISSDKTLKV
ncbi:monoglyceride lipase-like isoform X2 [Tachypleus tridentatus]|uniref:monoglyceride lipase-like isoform X2 n=1 Tax=Tachypleus tridentatus TaxID=6853 RepID=UPI003FD3664C